MSCSHSLSSLDLYSYKLFTMLIILDISSHWCQMYSTTALQQHHKSADGNKGRFFLVRWYYLSYPFFGYCCVGAEFTYVSLYIFARVNAVGTRAIPWFYLLNENEVKTIVRYCMMLTAPACAVKQVVNISQLCSSCYAVAERDAQERNRSE
jgi:CDP-diacylglycerol--inositol 3-phosphatidyltransferase